MDTRPHAACAEVRKHVYQRLKSSSAVSAARPASLLKAASPPATGTSGRLRGNPPLGDTVSEMADARIVHAGSMPDLPDDQDLQPRRLGLSLDSHQ